MTKPSLAVETLSICSGCEIAILDLHQALPGVLDAIDLKYIQVLMDFREPPEEGVTVGFVSGGVRNEEQVELLHKMRERSQILVAFGACSAFGGVPGLANLHPKEEILKEVYINTKSTVNPKGVIPHKVVPPILDELHPISDYVKVDYILPGCPPPPKLIAELVTCLLEGREFKLEPKTVCDQCPLAKEEKSVTNFKRWSTKKIIPERCLLEQGFQCMGPVTQGGCEARCPTALTPCRGCFGPTEAVDDQAAKMIGAIGSVVVQDPTQAPPAEEIVKEIPDLVGTYLRFSLAASTFKKAINVNAIKTKKGVKA
ncbi:MAG: F420-nonreducing hydrogenase [Candidatus Hodarchaeota archaeon]